MGIVAIFADGLRAPATGSGVFWRARMAESAEHCLSSEPFATSLSYEESLCEAIKKSDPGPGCARSTSRQIDAAPEQQRASRS